MTSKMLRNLNFAGHRESVNSFLSTQTLSRVYQEILFYGISNQNKSLYFCPNNLKHDKVIDGGLKVTYHFEVENSNI